MSTGGIERRVGRALAALVIAAAVSQPRCALASGGDSSAAGAALSILVAAPGAAVGLVTDTFVIVNLAKDGKVPRAWALTGTIAWGIATVALGVTSYIVSTQSSSSTGEGPNAGVAAGAWGIWSIAAGSLVLSIYGLANPRAPAAKAGIQPPVVVPTQGGAATVLTATF